MAWAANGCNANLLSEVTYGELGKPPSIEKMSGRMSPIRGRTMKEIDSQIGALQKENFDLKARIFYMEEVIKPRFKDVDIIKLNIELNVELEKYKADIHQKQQLLEKASETIDTISSQYNETIEKEVKKINQTYDEKLTNANQRVSELEAELNEAADKIKTLEDNSEALSLDMADKLNQIQDKVNQIKVLTANLEGRDQEIESLCNEVAAQKKAFTVMKTECEDRNNKLSDELEHLKTNLGRKDRDVRRLSTIMQEKSQIDGVTALERSRLKDEVDDANKELNKLKARYLDQDEDLCRRNDMIGKLEERLRQKETEHKELKDTFDEKMRKYTNAKHAIADLTKGAFDYKRKAECLEMTVKDREQLIAERDDLIAERDKTIARLKAQLADLEAERMKGLKKIAEHEEHIERLARTLGKQEGDLENFQDLLKKAEKSLQLSEQAVEALQKQLRRERCCCKENKRPSDAFEGPELIKLRKDLSDLQSQLETYSDEKAKLKTKCQDLKGQLELQGNQHKRELAAQAQIDKAHLETQSRQQKNELKDLAQAHEAEKAKLESEKRALHDKLQALGQQHQDELEKERQRYREKCAQLENLTVQLRASLSQKVTDATMVDAVTELLNKLGTSDTNVHITLHHSSVAADNGHMTSHTVTRESHVTHDGGQWKGTEVNTQAQDFNGFASGKKPGFQHDHRSNNTRIPVRHGSALSNHRSDSDILGLQHQLTDLMAKNSDLEKTLKATEETVHCQTQKMKMYRNMLMDSGLLPKSRSNSMPNVHESLSSTSESGRQSRSRNQDDWQASPRFRSASPRPCGRLGWAADNQSDIEKLNKENTKLRQQVEGYRKVLQVFQSRSPSPPRSESPESPKSSSASDCTDGQPATSMSSESATCLIDSWMELLDKFLSELSSQPHPGLPSSALDVTRLKRGMAQVRGAIKSLTDQTRDNECVSDHTLGTSQYSLTSPCSVEQNSMNKGDQSLGKSHHSLTSPLSVEQNLMNKSNQSLGRSHNSFTSPHSVEQNSMNKSNQSLGGIQHMGQNPMNRSNQSLGSSQHIGQSSMNKSNQSFGSSHHMVRSPREDFVGMFTDEASMNQFSQDSAISSRSDGTNSPNSSVLSIGSNGSQSEHGFNLGPEAGNKLQDSTVSSAVNPPSRPNITNEVVNIEKLRHCSEWSNENNISKLTLNSTQHSVSVDGLPRHTQVTGPQTRTMTSSVSTNVQDFTLGDNLPDITVSRILEEQGFDITLDNTFEGSDSSSRHMSLPKARAYKNIASDTMSASFLQDRTMLEGGGQSFEAGSQSAMDSLIQDEETKVKMNNTLKTIIMRLKDSRGSEISLQELIEKLCQLQRELEESLLKNRDISNSLQDHLLQSASAIQEKDKHLTEVISQLRSRSEQLREKVDTIQVREGDVRELKEQLHHCKTAADHCQHELENYKKQIIILREKEKKFSEHTSDLEGKVRKLEHDLDLGREKESKYKGAVSQARAQVNKLSTELEVTQDQLKKREQDIRELTETLEVTRDTVEKQDQQLIAQTSLAHRLTDQLQDKDTVIHEQKQFCQRLKEKAEHKIRTQSQELKKVLEDLKTKLQKTERENHYLSKNSTLIMTEFSKNKRELREVREREKLMIEFVDSDLRRQIVEKLSTLNLQLPEFTKTNNAIYNQCQDIFKEWDTVLKKARQDIVRFDEEGAENYLPTQEDTSSLPTRADHSPLQTRAETSSLPTREKTPGGSLHDAGSLPCKDMLNGSQGKHFSVPGPIYKQGISDDCLTYYVTDSPTHLAGLTQVRIDSDLRSLFAVGMIDTFEKLRKETNECRAILTGVSTRIKERLKHFDTIPASESVEYSTLKELAYSVENMRICVDSQLSQISCFWTSELPAPNERGEFVNIKLLNKISSLKEELGLLRKKYNIDRSQEENICNSLESTLDVMTRARHNLENRASTTRTEPTRSPSRSPKK
ncbi:uncharacterized protein LOC128223914 isoform X2 [Mya arenaria]|uniref:uncharacterized protein LOC128223914 isoform X2 n=1 Tax=Mya arenaria TaxID=6604 RepID=UPI0022E80F1B|nr:uncharacterized protein LOC128223914 isoform X2 [Mya arenaria]XP_052789338.1 uncharacterized protein LOC128223914 isoform X2 [Mya arenaria]